ncbi:MAG: homoserine dehydrogenase [Candidatus Omnitrophica bacterium]|nr:homoserine dehydrogenase [Candidatus Omnitrophota bacterium]
MKKINVGLIGYGTIGSGVAAVLAQRKARIKELTGIDIELKYICDKDPRVKADKRLLTRDAGRVLNDPGVDIVVELIGGIHPAKEIILAALKNNKDVVTANKALLAEEGADIFTAAKKFNREVRFEASVGGGIPIVKAIREGFVSNEINEIHGIINGTCNYILSRMSDEGCDIKVALKAAQKMGVAEADPRLDLTGIDSAHKLILLSGLSFGVFPKMDQVYCDGIMAVEPRDIRYAREMGYAIKLLAIAKRAQGEIEARVHPTLVPLGHLLANIKGVYNAIYVKGDLTGETLFYGEGAGKFPTASAVIADIVDLAKQISNPTNPINSTNPNSKLKIKKIDNIRSRYYIRFSALDKPGVLANISGILGKNNISIASVTQKEERIACLPARQANAVPIVMMTHEALESRMRNALTLIDKLPAIKKKSVALRVETL